MENLVGKTWSAFMGSGSTFIGVGISGKQQNKDQMNKNSSGVENLRVNYLYY